MDTDLEEVIALLAERQHGKLGRGQLLALGLGEKAIEYRVRKGRLRPEHRGVYSLGHRSEVREGRWMAAVLGAGSGAVLSHSSAAALWRIRNGGAYPHVTAPSRRHLEGATVHRSQLPPDEVTEEDGIPVTTPARTLLDLAPLIPIPSLARAIEKAESLERTPGPTLEQLLTRYPRRAGTPKLRRLLEHPVTRTRSDFEAEFTLWLRERGFPEPERNALVELGTERIEADLVWRQDKVIAELDTYLTHGSRQAFERDRRRDRTAQAHGWRTIRVTRMTAELERDLRRLLGASAAGSPSRRAAA